MKKIFFFLLIVIANSNSFAQIQRDTKRQIINKNAADSTVQNNNGGNKEIFKELNLTKEQRIRLKSIRQDAKAKRQDIKAKNLPPDEERSQIKKVNQDANAAVREILNDKQWEQYQELKKNKLQNSEE